VRGLKVARRAVAVARKPKAFRLAAPTGWIEAETLKWGKVIRDTGARVD
jgi:hypothetical protein